jgi:hypothetical protein
MGQSRWHTMVNLYMERESIKVGMMEKMHDKIMMRLSSDLSYRLDGEYSRILLHASFLSGE